MLLEHNLKWDNPRLRDMELSAYDADIINYRLSLAASYSPEDGASLKRARSAEAESPPTTQLYALRSRACPHRSPPGFGSCPNPEAAAAAERAASITMGPIKSRLKVGMGAV
jgi:hypothetical protein